MNDGCISGIGSRDAECDKIAFLTILCLHRWAKGGLVLECANLAIRKQNANQVKYVIYYSVLSYANRDGAAKLIYVIRIVFSISTQNEFSSES